jgi:hypothetical protein
MLLSTSTQTGDHSLGHMARLGFTHCLNQRHVERIVHLGRDVLFQVRDVFLRESLRHAAALKRTAQDYEECGVDGRGGNASYICKLLHRFLSRAWLQAADERNGVFGWEARVKMGVKGRGGENLRIATSPTATATLRDTSLILQTLGNTRPFSLSSSV